MSIHKTSAILIKARKYKEKDKLLTFYTEDFGKLLARCKGARDPLNHWGHNAEPPNICWLQLYEQNNFFIVTEIKPIFNVFTITKDYKRLIAFETFVQILDHYLEPQLPSQELYTASLSYLLELNRQETDPMRLSYQFLLHYLTMQGLPLLLDQCAHCKKPILPIEENFSISYEDGGLLCRECAQKVVYFNPISHGTIDLLKKIVSQTSGEENNRLDDFFQNWEDLDRIVKEYYKYRFNKKLQTFISLKKM